MHLLVDVRTSSLSDIPSLIYAEVWADIWKHYHPHDMITFLAFEGDPVLRHKCIFLPRGFTLFPKKLTTHAYGPNRIVSFSKYPSIAPNIPMILHVEELTDTLYPKHTQGLFSRHRHEYQYKKLLRSARHIILPHQEIGANLAELFGVDEEKMSVIPYLTPIENTNLPLRTILPYGICDEYFITEGTPGDEWNPIGLIEAYSEYIFTHHGTKKLIILGDLGESLSHISMMILQRGLTEKIKLIGVLSEEDRSILYSQSKGWIYIGHYYSRRSTVSLASSYNIPLYLSDIPALREYIGIHIHPNHIDSLPALLIEGHHINILNNSRPNNDHILQVYTRLIHE